MALEDAIVKRRSVRAYSKTPVTLGQLSQILFAAQGTTGKRYGHPLRAAPSAGALYPFEIYLFAANAAGLDPGVYHYAAAEHALELGREGDFGKAVSIAALEQEAAEEAAVVFALAAVFGRTKVKYGERALRYIYMEAGHISQNIYLQAASLGLGSVAMGAFRDEQVNRLIGLDGRAEGVVYLHAAGNV